MFQDI